MTEAEAMIVPAKLLVTPRVAELPTCQYTWQACAPFSKTTLLDVAVVKVEPAWNIKIELGSPPPLRVRAPVIIKLDEELYTPGTSVVPPRSAGAARKGVRDLASL